MLTFIFIESATECCPQIYLQYTTNARVSSDSFPLLGAPTFSLFNGKVTKIHFFHYLKFHDFPCWISLYSASPSGVSPFSLNPTISFLSLLRCNFSNKTSPHKENILHPWNCLHHQWITLNGFHSVSTHTLPFSPVFWMNQQVQLLIISTET
jgi:hypothetical protein